MYRTPMRRDLSPDTPIQYRDSPSSREGRSWSGGRSPPRQHRSPEIRGRSPGRHGRSPERRGRSSDRQGRNRSRSRHGGRPRSKSRGRPGRSRSRPRRSPSPSSRSRPRRSPSPPSRARRSPSPSSRSRPRRSPSPSSRSRPRRSPSPSSRSRPRRSPSPSSRSRPRRSPSPSSRARRSPSPSFRSRRSPSPYSQYPVRRRSPVDSYSLEGRSGDQHRLSPAFGSGAASEQRPLPAPHDRSGGIKAFGLESSSRVYPGTGDVALPPMPKKSILKKRTEVEPSSRDQSPQVDNGSVSSSGAGNSVEKNELSTDRPQLTPLPGSSAPSHGGPQPSWALSGSSEIKGCVTGTTPQCEQTDSPKVFQYASTIGNLFKKSDPESQTGPFSSVGKDGTQKGADQGGSSLLPLEQDSKPSPDPKQQSSSEIEDEERFLYGDEEDKKPGPQKAAPTPPAPSSPSKQEFEKIHDLLKTIGLDIGVAEIGKLAVRTQERLHGKKLAPKMSQPAAEPPPSTASPAEPKTKVSEPQVKMEKKEIEAAEPKPEPPVKPAPKEPTPPATQQSPAPAPNDKPQPIQQKPKETAAPKAESPVQPPPSSPLPDPTPPPISPSQIPLYSPYHHSSMVPAYSMPPPNYNPYSPYISYPTSSWGMYPPMPSNHVQTPPPAPHISVPAPTYNTRSNLRVIETTDNLSEAKTDVKPPTPFAALLAKQEANRKNKETEKLKVLDELDSVRKEYKVKRESLKTLSAKVDQLRVQQGLLLRKKRREKEGHKDPLLEELNNVLESAQKQINALCDEINTTKHKQQQLTKVAEILGVSPADLAEKSDPKKEERRPGSPAPIRDFDHGSRTRSDSSKSANDLKTSTEPVAKTEVKAKNGSKSEADTASLAAAHPPNITKSEDVKSKSPPPPPRPDPKKSPEPRSPHLSKSADVIESSDKSRSKSPRPSPPSTKTPPKPEEPPPFDIAEVFEYYDPGSHWCEDCNAICMTLPHYLLHLHNKKHRQSVKEVKQPWVKRTVHKAGAPKKQKVNIPLTGPEFLHPINGYYCELCQEVFPDHPAAVEHIRAYAHNDKYKKYIETHSNYEVLRREKKKAKLIAAQEAGRRQAEQKRKFYEQKHEAHEHSKSKKAKREEQEEERKAKSKRHTSASPPSSDHRRNKTPEKEPAKSQPFQSKYSGKASENKTQAAVTRAAVTRAAVTQAAVTQAAVTQAAVSSSKVDTAPDKPKEEEAKVLSLKPKGFAIKLLGKPSTLPGNALSPSHSAAPTTPTTSSTSPTTSSTSPTTSSTPAASSTTTSTAQTKVRPNLPSLMNIRLATAQVPMSKPAPLNTFLSIKSSSVASKSLPVVKNKPVSLFSEDLVSKAFGGEVVILKGSPQLDSTDRSANKEHEKTAGQSPKALLPTKGPDIFNVLISKKETQEVKSDKERAVSKPHLFPYPQKPVPVPTSTSHTTFSGPPKAAQRPGAATVQQTQNAKSPITNPASSAVSGTASINSSTSSSTNAKSESPINSSNQQTGKPGLTPRRDESKDQPPQEAKAPSKLEKETPQKAKASSFSMNPMTGRFEYLPVQQTKVNETNVQKLPETKPVTTSVTYVSSVRPSKPAAAPPGPVLKPQPFFNATTKLNQKFKKAPLSLPSSLFGYVQDAGYKDIKITSKSQKDKPRAPLPPPAQNKVVSSPAKPSAMQQELDSYYKQIASEEDSEDLTTSEDQDLEAAPLPATVTKAPLQAKVESACPVLPEVSGEDDDVEDMACEVPDAHLSSVSPISGWNFMQSSYASSKIPGSSNRQPPGSAIGPFSVKHFQSNETQVTRWAKPETPMEDLSVCVTCDSD